MKKQMRSILTVLGCLGAAFVCLMATDSFAGGYGVDPFIVASWNWRDASDRNRSREEVDLAADVVMAVTPHILALQEINDVTVVGRLCAAVNARWLPTATRAKRYEWSVSEPVGEGARRERYGFIWRRDRISTLTSEPFIHVDYSSRVVPGMDWVERDPAYMVFGVAYNLVLGSPLGVNFAVYSMHSSWDENQRYLDNKHLREVFDTDYTILCGDFNEGADDEVFDYLEEKAHWTIPLVDTTLGKSVSPYDQIWVDHDWTVVRSGVVDFSSWSEDRRFLRRAISDHYLVWVELAIPARLEWNDE